MVIISLMGCHQSAIRCNSCGNLMRLVVSYEDPSDAGPGGSRARRARFSILASEATLTCI
jgi:hypothetical protein